MSIGADARPLLLTAAPPSFTLPHDGASQESGEAGLGEV